MAWVAVTVWKREWDLPDGSWAQGSLFPMGEGWGATVTRHRTRVESPDDEVLAGVIEHVCVAENVGMNDAKQACTDKVAEWSQ